MFFDDTDIPSPEDLRRGLLLVPNNALKEILFQFKERLDDGYIDADDIDYYRSVVAIWLAFIEAADSDKSFVFNYNPLSSDEDDETLFEGLWDDE